MESGTGLGDGDQCLISSYYCLEIKGKKNQDLINTTIPKIHAHFLSFLVVAFRFKIILITGFPSLNLDIIVDKS